MSLLIAYLLIGALMVSGLMLDRRDHLNLGPGLFTTVFAFAFVWVLAVVTWPSLIKQSNMWETES